MASLLGFLGALGDQLGIGGDSDNPGALTRFNNAVDPVAAQQRAQAQVQTSALADYANDPSLQAARANGTFTPSMGLNFLAARDPEYADKAATLQAQNPLTAILQGNQTPAYNPAVSGPKDQNADASLPWSTQNAGASSAGSQAPQIYSPESADDKRNYKFLSTLPVPIQGLVKGLSDGDENSGAQAFKSPMSLALQAYAKQFDPSFSQTAFTTRNKTAGDFASSGKSGQAITSINTGTHHLAQVVLAGLQLPNQKSGTELGRWTMNNISEFLGQDPVTNFNSTVNTVAPELAKAAAGGGETDKDGRAAQKADFSPNGSPEQMLGAAAGKVQLLQGKADELGNTYKTNMGRGKTVITPENVQTQKDIVALHELAKAGKLYSTTEGFGNNFSDAAKPIIDRLKTAASDTSAPQGTGGVQSSAAKPPLDKATALAIAKQRGLIK